MQYSSACVLRLNIAYKKPSFGMLNIGKKKFSSLESCTAHYLVNPESRWRFKFSTIISKSLRQSFLFYVNLIKDFEFAADLG